MKKRASTLCATDETGAGEQEAGMSSPCMKHAEFVGSEVTTAPQSHLRVDVLQHLSRRSDARHRHHELLQRREIALPCRGVQRTAGGVGIDDSGLQQCEEEQQLENSFQDSYSVAAQMQRS